MEMSLTTLAPTALAPKAEPTTVWTEHLSLAELQRLTYFKWRYALHSQGFNAEEEARLLFLKWRYRTGGLTG
jgi:hypothetical protein